MEVNIVNLVPTGLGFLPSGGGFCKIAQKILRPAPRLLYCFSRPFLASASPPFSNCYLVIEFCPTVCDPMDCSVPGFPVHHHSRSLLKLMSIESVMPSNHLVLCRPLLLLPFTFMHWRRKWQPSPVFLPGESHGWLSLGGCRLWGRTESDTTEAT